MVIAYGSPGLQVQLPIAPHFVHNYFQNELAKIFLVLFC